MATFAADVAGFIDDLGTGPVALVGHSMGSVVARAVALARPDLVDRLVLVGSPLRTDTPAVRELAAEVARFGATIPRPFVEEFQAACIFDRGSVPAWFFDDCVAASAGVAPRVWRAALAGLMAEDHTAGWGRSPVRPWWSAGGRMRSSVRPIRRNWPGRCPGADSCCTTGWGTRPTGSSRGGSPRTWRGSSQHRPDAGPTTEGESRWLALILETATSGA